MLGLEDIIGCEVISADAIIVGTVEGISVDSENWRSPSVRVMAKKGLEAVLNKKKKTIGSHRIHITTAQISSVTDTVTLAVKMEEVRDILLEDQAVPQAAGMIINKRVVTKDGRQIGYVDNIHFDPAKNWEIPKIGVKLDRSAKQELNLNKTIAPSSQIVILTKDVKTIGDMVMLRIDTTELKDYLTKKPVSKN